MNTEPIERHAGVIFDNAVTVQDIFDFLARWFAGGQGTIDRVSHPSVNNPYGYCGYYADAETVGMLGKHNGGLYHVRHRVYDPISGSFLQRDPAGFVDGMNLYEYVSSSPIARIDPTGLDWMYRTNYVVGGITDVLTIGLSRAANSYLDQSTDTWASDAATWVGEEVLYGKGSPSLARDMDNGIAHREEITADLQDDPGTAEAAESYSKGEREYQQSMDDAAKLADIAVQFNATAPLLASPSGILDDIASGTQATRSAQSASQAKVPSGVCFVAGTFVWRSEDKVPIENLRVGDRVLTTETASCFNDICIPCQESSKLIRLCMVMPNPDGSDDDIYIDMLRTMEFAARVGAHETGDVFTLILSEMGLIGQAKLLYIDYSPTIAKGPGRLVLATLTHLNGDVYTLCLANGDTLEPTGTHRLFSETQHDWVETSKLTTGDFLRTINGSVKIESVVRKPGVHRVYNIEVQTEHTYFVGTGGVLSHNNNPCAKSLPKNPDDLLDAGYIETSHPSAKAAGHRTFENPTTGDKLRFDKGKSGSPGWEGVDHYHRTNPQSTGKGDAMLDVNGNPVPKGCDKSHLPTQ